MGCAAVTAGISWRFVVDGARGWRRSARHWRAALRRCAGDGSWRWPRRASWQAEPGGGEASSWLASSPGCESVSAATSHSAPWVERHAANASARRLRPVGAPGFAGVAQHDLGSAQPKSLSQRTSGRGRGLVASRASPLLREPRGVGRQEL